MQLPRHAFLSGWDAIFILIGLHFTEVLVGAGFHDFGGSLGLDDAETSALTLLLASGIVYTLAMKFTRTGWRDMFHATPASPWRMGALLLLPVMALVPALSLACSSLMDLLVEVAPLARWEEELFANMAEESLAAILLVVLLAPVLEEMLFRGIILRGFLARYPRWPAIVASAILFGASHLNIYQFMVGLLIGIPLGWLYERTRSLIPCIALHAAYNVSVTLLWTQDPVGASGAWWDGTWIAWTVALGLAAASSFVLVRMLQPARA